jgi:hypothetical protein
MIRNLSSAVVTATVLAVATAVLASPALAANFSASSYPAHVSGVQTNTMTFTFGGGSVTCKKAAFTGSLSGKSELQILTPTYSECTAFGFVGATITGFGPNECYWGHYSNGTMDLDCPAGKHVKIDAGPCTVTLGPSGNQGLSSIAYTDNVPSSGHVTGHVNLSGVHHVISEHSVFCSLTPGTYTNGTVSGSVDLTAANGMAPLDYSFGP